ncbi:Proposed peptidoglycan lipid II flippase MurJ [Olavius algarvensis spirochete endosymbiont]|nr:Proposed peptidoglycan lipid II flippase MurJ [Olavius algarvensis spirochete endosymbiont]
MINSASNQRSARSAFVIMGCTLISRILGFVRTATIGALFGAGGTADVINLIFNIPNNLRKLLAEGALSTAFVPELSREIVLDTSGLKARRLGKTIIGFQIIIIAPVLLGALLFPEQVLYIFERFSDPYKKELSVVLLRWMMPYLLFVSLSAIMMAVHNSHNRFLIPALTPIAFSICVILFLLFGQGRWGTVSIGAGVLAGGLAQILVQYPSFRRMGYGLIPSFDFNDDSLKRVLRKWLPMLLTSSLFVINSQIAMLLASTLPDGNTSSLTYAIVFFQLPFGIFSASIATVLYPKMSRCAALNDNNGLIDCLSFGYRNLWALLVPSAMILVLLGEPIVAIAFQRRAFTPENSIATANVLAAYSVGMPFIGLFGISQRALYALGAIKRSFFCALLTVFIDIALSLVFVFWMDGDSIALAWANSIAFTIGSILQYILIRRISKFRIAGEVLSAFGKILIGNTAGVLVILGFYQLLGRSWWLSGVSWTGVGLLALIALVSSAIIVLFYGWMKIETVSLVLNSIRQDNDGEK